MKTIAFSFLLFCHFFTNAFAQSASAFFQIDEKIREQAECTNSSDYFDKYISELYKKFKEKTGEMHVVAIDMEADVFWDSEQIRTYARNKENGEWMFRHLDKEHFHAANVKIDGKEATITFTSDQKDAVLRTLNTLMELMIGIPIIKLD